MNMKHNILLGAAILLTMAGCAKEIKGEDPVYGVEKTFTAYAQETEATKTYLTAEHRVWWQSDDAISVFAGGQNSRFVVSSLKFSGAQAEFSGITPESGMYYALYPYQKDATFAKEKFTAVLPSEQSVTSSSFDPAAALAVCRTESQTLKFRNVGSIVSVLTGNEGVTSVKLTGKGAYLSGKAEISFNDGGLAVNVTDGTGHVELKGAFETNTAYYFVVLPGKYDGFSLQFTRNDGKTVTVSTDTGADIGSNGYFTLGSFTFTEDEWEKGSMKDFDSFVLNGYDEVQAFLDDTVEERINVRDLIITGSDVTSSQLLKLKDKVLAVRGTFQLSGVLADEWENTPEGESLYLETEQILYNYSNGGQNGIRLEGSIIFEDIPCSINPNGLSGVSVCGGDLIIRNMGWPFDWNGQDNLTQVRGDLIIEHNTKSLANFHFPKLAKVGGSLVVNDCDNGFWELKDFADGLSIGGDLIVTGNANAFEYVEWMQGLLKISSIGGNVTIFDNRMNANPARYCVVRDMYKKGIIRPDAVITLGTTEAGFVDFKTVPSCDGDDPDPVGVESYTLNGYSQVQAFLNGGSDKIAVMDFTVSGADVTVEQMHSLVNRVSEVRGDLTVDGVCTDDSTDEWLDTRKIVALNPKKGLIFKNLRHSVNPNGLAEYPHVYGDLKFIDCNWNLDGGWAEASVGKVTEVDGDLVVSNFGHGDHIWRGQFFTGVTRIGGSLIVEKLPKSYITMPALKEVGGDVIFRDCEKELFSGQEDGLAALQKVGGDLILENLEYGTLYFELPALTEVGGDVRFENVSGEHMHHDAGCMVNLKKVGGSVIIRNMFKYLSQADNLTFASLREVGGDFHMEGVTGIERFFDTRDGGKYGLCITTLGGSLIIKDNPDFKSFTGFDHIGSIGGDIVVTGNDSSWPAQSSDIRNIGFCIIKEYVDNGIVKSGSNVSIQYGLSDLSACGTHFQAPGLE